MPLNNKLQMEELTSSFKSAEYLHFANSIYIKLYRFCRLNLKLQPFDADELIHETILLLGIKWREIDKNIAYPWCLKTLKNKHSEMIKANNKILPFNDKYSDNIDFMDKLFDFALSDAAIADRKDKIIASLSKEDRVLYDYVHVQKLKYELIADKLGINEGAIKTRVVRMRKRIYKKVSDIFDF